MKRARKLLERITDRDNLRFAFYRALRGKRDRQDARDFAADLEDNLRRMASELWSGEADGLQKQTACRNALRGIKGPTQSVSLS